MGNPDTRFFTPLDVPAALGLLTRLPVPVSMERAAARGARAAWAYPVVGLLLGAVQALALWVMVQTGLAPALAAGLALALVVVLTGAMHEDGLADSADGLWGGWDRARRLAIMKDSQIGTYGVLALVLVLGLRWLALAALAAQGAGLLALVAIAALSRANMVLLLAVLPNARGAGLAHLVGRAPRSTALAAVLIAAVAAIGLGYGALIGAGLMAALACGLIARAKIGGQTGDILGASQQISEAVMLIVLVWAVI